MITKVIAKAHTKKRFKILNHVQYTTHHKYWPMKVEQKVMETMRTYCSISSNVLAIHDTFFFTVY